MIENRFRGWYRSAMVRPLVLAHRGDSSHAPENTLEAARLGLDSGADGWELDVRLSKDGVPVVLHDESLARTTDVALRFEGDPRGASGSLAGGFLLEEIRRLDAGSWFVEPAGGPRSAAGFGTLDSLPEADRVHFASGRVRVPTLAEALALTVEAGRVVNVEIKPDAVEPGRLVRAVLDAIREAGALELVAVSSFDHEVVRLVSSAEPRVATGALVAGPIDREAWAILEALGADALHAPPSAVGPSTAGVPLLIYTINDATPGGPADRLAEAGVAGLFTDDPAPFVGRFGLTPSAGRTRPRWGTPGRPWADPSADPTPPGSR